MGTADKAGSVSGLGLAPFTAAISALRHSRMFHPSGLLFRARTENVAASPAARAVAERLRGVALVRFSSAWWKAREWPDVLGCALRFSSDVSGVVPREGDQDLLFATIRRPWTLPFSPLTTRYRDFLQNHYYAVSPFLAEPLGRVEWRLSPESGRGTGGARGARLQSQVESGHANLLLEWSPYRMPLRAFDDRSFQPLLRLHDLEALTLDQEALRFDPFRDGRGITPVGFIHGLRRASYASSQRARPRSSWDAEPALAETPAREPHAT
jgi:hypothetical protein